MHGPVIHMSAAISDTVSINSAKAEAIIAGMLESNENEDGGSLIYQ